MPLETMTRSSTTFSACYTNQANALARTWMRLNGGTRGQPETEVGLHRSARHRHLLRLPIDISLAMLTVRESRKLPRKLFGCTGKPRTCRIQMQWPRSECPIGQAIGGWSGTMLRQCVG